LSLENCCQNRKYQGTQNVCSKVKSMSKLYGPKYWFFCHKLWTIILQPKFICGPQHPDLCLQMRGWWLLWPVFRSYSKFVIRICGLWFIFFWSTCLFFLCTALSDIKIWKGNKKEILREHNTGIVFKYSMWWDQCKLL